MREILNTLFRNIAWGVMWGMVGALGFMLFSLARHVFQGEAPFKVYSLTFRGAIAMYLVEGLLTGVLVGLLRPLAQYFIGAMVLGFSIAFTVYGVAGWAMEGPMSNWDSVSWGALVLVTVIGGILVGNEIWKNKESFLGPKSEIWRLL